MASVNLEDMDAEELLALRAEIDGELEERSRELRQQLARLEGLRGSNSGRSAGRTSVLKGVKVEPKYQGPNGETWAGRGAHPKWLAALLDEGHHIEDFAIGGAEEDEEEVEKAKPARAAAKAKRGAAKKGGGRRKAA